MDLGTLFGSSLFLWQYVPSFGRLTRFHVYSRKWEALYYWFIILLYIGGTIFVMYKFYSLIYGRLR